MLVNICIKFHEGILNSIWVTELTRPYQFQRVITPKIRNPELRFLRSTRSLMLLYICLKFHENISNSFGVTDRTRFCDRQTDRRPGQKQHVSQTLIRKVRPQTLIANFSKVATCQLRHSDSQLTICVLFYISLQRIFRNQGVMLFDNVNLRKDIYA